MSKYLLPCSQCGAHLTIDVGQAGQIIACECGSETEVPTMRVIRKLGRADVPQAREDAESNWTQQQGWLFATGLALLVVGTGLCAYLLWERSKLDTAPPEDFARTHEEEQIDESSPLQLWGLWQQLRDYQLSQTQTPQYQLNRQQAQQYLVTAMISGGLAATGLCTLVAAFFFRPKAKRRRAVPSKGGAKAP